MRLRTACLINLISSLLAVFLGHLLASSDTDEFLGRIFSSAPTLAQKGELSRELLSELAFSDKDQQVRRRAQAKLVELHFGRPHYSVADDYLEAERQKLLDPLVLLLKAGDYEGVRERFPIVIAALGDSQTHKTRMTAIEAVHLCAQAESARGVAANDSYSVFRAVFSGLLDRGWCGSWAHAIRDAHYYSLLGRNGGDTGPLHDRSEEVAALTEAFQAFGPQTAQVAMERLQEATHGASVKGRDEIAYEAEQVVEVMSLLDGHVVQTIEPLIRLIEALEPAGQRAFFERDWVVRALLRAAEHDLDKVQRAVERSRIQLEYRQIRAELDALEWRKRISSV